MGVYIPPQGGNSKPPNGNGKPVDSTQLTLLYTIPRNPSIGLFWGPLVPALDNKPALYFMTALQFAAGALCFNRARSIVKSRMYQSRTSTFLRALVPTLGGATLIFGSGLEVMRLNMPMDPWADEAHVYRRLATAQGDNPSSWFGAYKYYRPMSLNDWTDKSKVFFMERNAEVNEESSENPGILIRMKSHAKYGEVYVSVRDKNEKRFGELLEKDLADVHETNRANRIDAVLDGTSKHVNPEYVKPPITLGNHSIELDDEFDFVWLNFDPWEELRTDVDSEIRMVPTCPEKFIAEKPEEVMSQ